MRFFWLLAVVLGLMGGLAFKADALSEGFEYGLVAYHIPFDSYKLTDSDLERIAANGVTAISLDFAWRDIEPTPGFYDYTYFDAVVSKAKALGLSIFAKVGNGYNGVRPTVPEWTKALPNEEYLNRLSEYTRAVAQRYGKDIAYYALENEPNIASLHILSRWREGNWDQSRVQAILKTLATTILNADPRAKTMLSVACAPGWIPWVRQALSLIQVDAIGIQSYPNVILPDPEMASGIALDIQEASQFNKDVYVLETGYHTNQRSEENQARYVEVTLKASISAGAKGIFYYEYQDNPEEYPEQEKHFGLVRHDKTPKMAWVRYGELIVLARAGRLSLDDISVSPFVRLYHELQGIPLPLGSLDSLGLLGNALMPLL